MKAATYRRYGGPDVIELVELPKPAPGDGEILIKVRAASVSSADWRLRSLSMPRGFGVLARPAIGFTGPRKPILGSELSGTVEAVGKGVTRFKPGDAVFAYESFALGCHVEYKVMRAEGTVQPKPDALSVEEAAALCFGGTTALIFLRKAGIKAGDRVLINGASGSVGSAAVQIARHYGADVTGVCSAGNTDLVKSIGAQRTIDYAREDFARSGESYDIIFDPAGNAPYARVRGALRDEGRLASVVGSLGELLTAPWHNLTTRHKVIAGPTSGGREEMAFLADLAERGAYRPLIDATYPFEKIVDAHRHVDTGRKRGNVVVTMND